MLSLAGEWNPGLLARHAEALDLLWSQRLAAVRSPDWTVAALARHDERIEAHADGLVLAADEADALLEARLGADEVPAALGAAHVLLCREDARGARWAEEAFLAASGPALEAFRLALRFAPPERHGAALERAAKAPEEARAVAALAAQAFHGGLGGLGQPFRLLDLARSTETSVRRLAWEAISFLGADALGGGAGASLRPHLAERFRASLGDPDAAVRQALLVAAAWTRQPWLLETLRARATAPAPDDLPALGLLAVLGTEADLPRLLEVAATAALGPDRFALLGASGRPAAAEPLLDAMGSEDRPSAVAAAAAFRALTGVDVARGERVPLREAGPDELDARFVETVRLPDPGLARTRWQALRRALPGATRLCQGFDVGVGVPPEAWALVDLASRADLALRCCFERRPGPGAAELERFPRLGADETDGT